MCVWCVVMCVCVCMVCVCVCVCVCVYGVCVCVYGVCVCVWCVVMCVCVCVCMVCVVCVRVCMRMKWVSEHTPPCQPYTCGSLQRTRTPAVILPACAGVSGSHCSPGGRCRAAEERPHSDWRHNGRTQGSHPLLQRSHWSSKKHNIHFQIDQPHWPVLLPNVIGQFVFQYCTF